MVIDVNTHEVELLVLGAGPGGYVAACAGADAGLRTAVVEAADVPGGVCLREGCIPSKALLHVAKIIRDTEHAARCGLAFAPPEINVAKLRGWKNGVIRKLSLGVKGLLSGRSVEYFNGRAEFENSTTVRIEGDKTHHVRFRHCIIATGSTAKTLPETLIPRELVWLAPDALAVQEIPRRLLVIGGGYIGLELGQVYAALGSEVTVIEVLDQILTGVDPDLAKPLVAKLSKQMKAIYTSAGINQVRKVDSTIAVTYTLDGEQHTDDFDRVLVSVGRRPNSNGLGLDKTQVKIGDYGFIEVDAQRRTTDERIFAIGDVVGNPMLAHKAMHEAKVAVDVIAGKPAEFNPSSIPAVVFTDPEVAWCGVTEAEAEERGLDVTVTKFGWDACGRAVAMARTDGLTKMIFENGSRRLLGVGIVGAHAGDLISEAALALEMGATADNFAATIHPHPATSETLAEAADAMLGRAIHGVH
ncbi:MAG: dihydrolipoyl dehydrogenase [Planctomycetota bacterium]